MIDHAPTISGPAQTTRDRTDDDKWTALILGAALVATALATGLIFTFSTTVMPNLADADDITFVTTMQRYNPNPVFPLTFTAALGLTIATVFMQRRHGAVESKRWTIAALVLFGIVVAVTAAIHFPLNDDIDQANLDAISDVARVRDDVETPWVVWNLVRTAFSIAAVAALARSTFLYRRDAYTRNRRAAGAPPWGPPNDHFETAR